MKWILNFMVKYIHFFYHKNRKENRLSLTPELKMFQNFWGKKEEFWNIMWRIGLFPQLKSNKWFFMRKNLLLCIKKKYKIQNFYLKMFFIQSRSRTQPFDQNGLYFWNYIQVLTANLKPFGLMISKELLFPNYLFYICLLCSSQVFFAFLPDSFH